MVETSAKCKLSNGIWFKFPLLIYLHLLTELVQKDFSYFYNV